MIDAVRTLSIAGVMLLVATTANAQGTSEQASACIGDAFRLCSAYIPDRTQIEACLESKKRQLTPACRAQFDEPEPKPRPVVRRARPSNRDQ
jgi:hypothetical protein